MVPSQLVLKKESATPGIRSPSSSKVRHFEI